MRRKFKLGLLITTAILLISFIITLFNPFVDDDVKRYDVRNYYEITFTEGETRYDEDYFSIEIKNVSGEDVYNNEFIFGISNSSIATDNYIWFRSSKIDVDDVVTIKIYEDNGRYTIEGKIRAYDISTNVLALSPQLPDLDLDDCMVVTTANIDSETPEIYRLENKFWSLDKVITLSGFVVSGIGLLFVMFINRHVVEDKKEEE